MRLHNDAFLVLIIDSFVDINANAIPHTTLFAINIGMEIQANGGSENILQIMIVGKFKMSANTTANNSTIVSPLPSMVQERFETFAMLHHTINPWMIDQTIAQRNQISTTGRDFARSEDGCEGLK